MILIRAALWAEERKRLTEAIREVEGDAGSSRFLRKKRRQLDDEMMRWLRDLIDPRPKHPEKATSSALSAIEAGTALQFGQIPMEMDATVDPVVSVSADAVASTGGALFPPAISLAVFMRETVDEM